MKPSALIAVALLASLIACSGGDFGSATREDDGLDDVPVTVPAEGVDLSAEFTWVGEELSADVAVTNHTGGGIVFVQPSTVERDGRTLFRALLPEVEPGFSDALTIGVAPPSYPAIVVKRRSSVEFHVPLGWFTEKIEAAELCLEVAEADSSTRDLRNGEEGSVSYREQGTPARVACSGSVEIAEESFDDPVGEE